MSLTRTTLVVIQAIGNQLACTPPNPTPQKARYHTNELYILQIAPFIFKIHQTLLWICTVFETLFYLSTIFSTSSPAISSPVCLSSHPDIRVTPLFVIGVLAACLGTYIRLDCFHTLGQLFTFDLTILPEHKLITRRFYGYVRHPSYTGSMLLVAGLALSHLTKGSWLTECSPLGSSGAIVVWAAWWIWTLAVGLSRAEAEDKELKKTFNEEWDAYAANVPWWFFPGLL